MEDWFHQMSNPLIIKNLLSYLQIIKKMQTVVKIYGIYQTQETQAVQLISLSETPLVMDNICLHEFNCCIISSAALVQTAFMKMGIKPNRRPNCKVKENWHLNRSLAQA